MNKLILITIASLLLMGCLQQPKVDQAKICLYTTNEEAKQCKAGELSWFRPPSNMENAQLPLNVAGVYCDFNYPLMYNNAGVICVFTDKRFSLLNQ